MSPNFLSCERDQQLLVPTDLREWLPADHLAWFVLDSVSELDLEPFFRAYRADGWGRAAHDPEMMVALCLYAYATGERSSRRIERRLTEDVAYRVITANRAPDHSTIARFRARHAELLAELFGQILGLCAKAGLVSVGTIALDGTRIVANAADSANRSYSQLATEILEEAARVDEAEDELYGDRRGDELPPELADPKTRRERLREAKRALDEEHAEKVAEMAAWERAKAEYTARTGFKQKGAPTKPRPIPPKERARINLTDPDSRPVKTGRGFIQGYTAQAVTTEEQVIVAADVISGGNERGRLRPMAEAAEAELKRAGVEERPSAALADAGYWNGKQIKALEAKGIEVLVPPDADTRGAPSKIRSGLDYERMRERLAEPDSRALYRRRQQMIEPVFAQIKNNLRAGRFSRRGLASCRAEWRLITATHNLLKLYRSGLAPAGA
jgi:transposase